MARNLRDLADICYSARPSDDFMPALDGLRALSVVLVMISHVGFGNIVPGGFGVTVFFFVSGLLITRQLMSEHEKTGRVALGYFYARRLLRLYPALLGMVTVGGLLYILAGGTITLTQTAAALFYAANYFGLAGGFDTSVPGRLHPYSILWSLAVEEHYYLAFPIAVGVFAHHRGRLVLSMLGVILLVTLWRQHVMMACQADTLHCLGGDTLSRVVYATDTRIDSILYGAVLAVLAGTARCLRLLQTRLSFLVGVILLVASLLIRQEAFRDSLRFAVQGVGMFLAIGSLLFCAPLRPLRAILSARPTRLVGRWSYGLYLWHWIVLSCASFLIPAAKWQTVQNGHAGHLRYLVFVPVIFALSFAAATASYYGVERPTLRLRRRFGSHSVADSAGV